MDGAISIGRNVGDVPMGSQAWEQFVGEVQHAITSYGGTLYATAYGHGEWQGIPEDNAVITFGNVPDDEARILRTHLAWLAEDYEQDAIALVPGVSELVSA